MENRILRSFVQLKGYVDNLAVIKKSVRAKSPFLQVTSGGWRENKVHPWSDAKADLVLPQLQEAANGHPRGAILFSASNKNSSDFPSWLLGKATR